MYVVHSDVIRENVKEINDAFRSNGLPLILSYSCKTNSMPEVLGVMKECGVLPEVVSEYEYDTVGHGLCVVNGVAMDHYCTAMHVVNGDYVNFNDIEQAMAVRKYLDNDSMYNIGLRIRFDDSRFGVHVDDLERALGVLSDFKYEVVGLHCHVTGTRELSKYRKKVHDMVGIIKNFNHELQYVDFGGSMYGKMSDMLSDQFDEVGSFYDYARIIKNEFVQHLWYKPTVILELGTALVANAVSIMATVIRVDEYRRAVLNVDKFTFGMAGNKDLEYTIFPAEKLKMASKPLQVYGCTCIEDDVLIKDCPYELKIGDMIEFKNCGAYSYCFEPDFIIPRQEVKVI